MDGDITKRMGENIGKPFTIADVSIGRILPVYSIGDTTYKSSNITQMGCGVGRCSFGDISTVPYTIGVNIGAGAELVHRASEETIC